MTQKEVIEQLKGSVSKLFWERAVLIGEISNGTKQLLLRISDGTERLFFVNADGQIETMFYPTTIDSAKAHLRLHEQDWQRTNPEFVREMAWKGDETRGVSRLYYARFQLIAYSSGWIIFDSAHNQIMSERPKESIKEHKAQAIEALIQHLKKVKQ